LAGFGILGAIHDRVGGISILFHEVVFEKIIRQLFE